MSKCAEKLWQASLNTETEKLDKKHSDIVKKQKNFKYLLLN